MIPALAFLYGAVIGSFLNVCILRLPQGESVVSPRSRCPRCKNAIAPYDNIPIFSWLILGGRCRGCREPISPLYPMVEFATGLLFLVAILQHGLSWEFAKMTVFSALLVVLVVTDWRERILPDKVNFPGIAIGVLFSLVVPVGDGAGAFLVRLSGIDPLPVAAISLLDALLGALAGGGLLYLIGELYYLLRHQEGMGFGDVKMMAMVGVFLGPKLTLFTIFMASVIGALAGGLFLLVSKKESNYELPFGTFLGFSAWVAPYGGIRVLNWYLGLFP